MISIEEQEKLKEYLFKRSELIPANGCREWKRRVQTMGYGQATWKGRTFRAHQLAYLAYHRELPRINEQCERLVVRHHPCCKSRACIAEAHLSIGTYKDNAYDKVVSGTATIGEKNPWAKMTDAVALQIISSRFPKGHPQYKTQLERAMGLNVTISMVKGVDSGENWKHLKRDATNPRVPKSKPVCRNTSRHNCATCDEKTAKEIIASKKHKYDPDYKTQQERALLHSVTKSVIRGIDTGRTWQFLPRPAITEFPKPSVIWDEEILAFAFEKVKARCKYDDTDNPFVGSPCLSWQGKLHNGRPVIDVKGKTQLAYILACEYGEGRARPSNLVTRHLCNNQICCEPTHLKFGTRSENGIDVLVHGGSKSIYVTLNVSSRDLTLGYTPNFKSNLDFRRLALNVYLENRRLVNR
jgi:hypothetical protein